MLWCTRPYSCQNKYWQQSLADGEMLRWSKSLEPREWHHQAEDDFPRQEWQVGGCRHSHIRAYIGQPPIVDTSIDSESSQLGDRTLDQGNWNINITVTSASPFKLNRLTSYTCRVVCSYVHQHQRLTWVFLEGCGKIPKLSIKHFILKTCLTSFFLHSTWQYFTCWNSFSLGPCVRQFPYGHYNYWLLTVGSGIESKEMLKVQAVPF